MNTSDAKRCSPHPRDHSCVYIFDPVDGVVLCEVPLIWAAFTEAAIGALRSGATVDEWIATAILEKYPRSGGEPPILSGGVRPGFN